MLFRSTIDIAVEGADDLPALMYGFERMVAVFSYLQNREAKTEEFNFTNQPAVQHYKTDTSEILAKARARKEAVKLPAIDDLQVQARAGQWVVNVDELLANSVISRHELESKVAAIGGRMDNGVDVYAAVMLLAAEKGQLEYGEFALFGFAPEPFVGVMKQARTDLFNANQKRAKVGRREQDNHSHEQNAVAGKLGRFSIFFVANEIGRAHV